MDSQGLLPRPVKRRRKHSPSFKKAVVAETYKPGSSVAGVAQHFKLNDNLVHKSRRQLRAEGCGEFVRVPASVRPEPVLDDQTIRIELATATGILVLHWPMDRPHALAQWVKALS